MLLVPVIICPSNAPCSDPVTLLKQLCWLGSHNVLRDNKSDYSQEKGGVT